MANWKGDAATDTEWFKHCDIGDFVTASEVSAAPEPSLELTAEPTPDPSVVDEQTASFTNDDGYEYEIRFTLPELSATSSIEDSKPGEAAVSVTRTGGSLSVTNVTSGRNAPLPSVYLVPIWKDSSPACSVEDRTNMKGDTILTRLTDALGSDPAPYCGGGKILEVYPGTNNFEDIPSGDSYSLDSIPDSSSFTFTVAEKELSRQIGAWSSPDGWILFGASKVDVPNKLRIPWFYHPRELWRSPGL